MSSVESNEKINKVLRRLKKKPSSNLLLTNRHSPLISPYTFYPKFEYPSEIPLLSAPLSDQPSPLTSLSTYDPTFNSSSEMPLTLIPLSDQHSPLEYPSEEPSPLTLPSDQHSPLTFLSDQHLQILLKQKIIIYI